VRLLGKHFNEIPFVEWRNNLIFVTNIATICDEIFRINERKY